MDEQNIPIDINNNKLLDWLISRRHVSKDWQVHLTVIREKINNAIQDMPEHKDIVTLLSGQHINYFHCLKIVDILKETEASTVNLFGRYGSQRMKDWLEIVGLYVKENVYLAEAAQILIRNVTYEIPSLRKQVIKLEQSQQELEKKIKDYTKNEANVAKEFTSSCEQLGIEGKKIRVELQELPKELSSLYSSIADKIKLIKPALDLYSEFHQFHFAKSSELEMLSLLNYIITFGNTTTFEYIYGEKPISIELDEDAVQNMGSACVINEDKIDFGDGDIDFEVNIDYGDDKIDWSIPTAEEDFEIVDHVDIQTENTLEESGIVVERCGTTSGIAKGKEALTLLDNPEIRTQIITNLTELQAFLKMRLFEMSGDSDTLIVSQMQNAPTIVQMQTIDSVMFMNDAVNIALMEMTSKRVQHLHNIKHFPKYLDNLTADLKQKLVLIDRIKQNKVLLEEQISRYKSDANDIKPAIKLLMDRTKELQNQVQQDISRKYKGRTVNIVGGVNVL